MERRRLALISVLLLLPLARPQSSSLVCIKSTDNKSGQVCAYQLNTEETDKAINDLKGELNSLRKKVEALQTNNSDMRSRVQNLPTSCAQIRTSTNNATENGVYYIRDSNDISFPVYCDMNAGGGGWTLVASIHENNIRSTGRCSVGDKWSSEHGNEGNSQVGAEAWFNYETFGNVVSATSEDYKNQAYFDLQARDVMIWQVPNNTSLQRFQSDAYLKYRTRNGFLSLYGGNMFHLYKDYFPIKSGVYTKVTNNGPAIPVVFDKGNASEVRRHFGANRQPRVDPGYIQFRAINNEGNAFALCPGIRVRSNHGDIEHTCIGSTADNAQTNYCGDFASFSWDGYGTGLGANTDLILLESTFLIFYR